MSSLWNFVKKHRGKIVVTGAIAGGAYVAKKFLDEHPELTAALLGPRQPSALEDQLRRDYVFEAQQRSCDSSLEDLGPKVAQRLRERWDLEAQAEAIRKDSSMSAAAKRQAWERMKEESLSRLLGAAYGQAVLVLALKTQMSVLAGLIYRDAKPQPQSPPLQELKTAAEGVWGWLTGAEVPGSSGASAGAPNGLIQTREERPPAPAAEAQQLFLQSLQYFIMIGLTRMAERVEAAVREVVGEAELSLAHLLNEDKLYGLLSAIRKATGLERPGALGVFVVPLPERGAGEGGWAGLGEAAEAQREGSLAWLLEEQRRWLSGPEACGLLKALVEAQVAAAVGWVCDESGQLGEGKGLPVARVVPLLSDAFGRLTARGPEAPFQQLLLNRRLHSFAKTIFEDDPHHRDDD